MTANPVELIGGITSTSNVPKADFVAWAKARIPQVLANASEIRSTTLAGQLVVQLKSTGIVYLQDTSDTTTADDGITCIVSSDGKRLKPSPYLTPTATALGGVFSKAVVTGQFLTGLGTDGNFSSAALPFPALASIGAVFSKAAVAHKFLTAINTDGTVSNAQPDADDITFTAVSGAPIILGSKFRNIFMATDYASVDPTGSTDSATGARTAISAVPYGGRLIFPSGNYLLNSPDPATGGAGILDFSNFPNKSISIEGVGWNLKYGGVYTNPQGTIFRIGSAIGTTCDFIYSPPIQRVTAFQLKDFAVIPQGGVFNTPYGRNGVHIDVTGNNTGYHEYFYMGNVFLDNFANGHSVCVEGQSSGNTMIDSIIHNCAVMNMKFNNVADNITVSNCTFGANAIGTTNGPNRGIYVKQVAGATSFRALNCNFVNQDGMIVIDAGLTPILRDCEFEQNPGVNAHGSLVDLAGSGGGLVQGAVVTGCSITNNSYHSILTFTTLVGGSSYTNGFYGGVPLTGGTGTGALANITVSGGQVTAVTIIPANNGINYTAGDVLSAAAANIGGTGTGFTVTVSGIDTGLYPNINVGTSIVGAQIFANTMRQPSSQSHVVIASGSTLNKIFKNLGYTSGTAGPIVITDPGPTSLTQFDGPSKTYTPTVTPSSGAFTTVVSGGAYRLDGKMLSFEQDVTITTVGTGSGSVFIGLPSGFTAKRNQCASGREFVINGHMLNASISTSGIVTNVTQYDNTSIIAAGVQLIINGDIEIT